MRRTVLCLLVPLGCTSDAAAPKNKPNKDDPAAGKLAGVYPDKFECASVVSANALGQLVGGTAKAFDSGMPVERGLTHPCEFQVQTAGGIENWRYDFDCRDNWKKTADALFVQYKQGNAEQIEHYNQLSDAGAIKANPDAGLDKADIHAVGAPTEVAVGAKGLDHHGLAILFIDDDAPCYVRVFGPDAARRLELAKLVAKNLTFANAPMTPRPFP